MSLPKSIYKYNDIARDLRVILNFTGLSVRRAFSTPAKAQRWRMRAYMYRSLLEEQDGGSSVFNHLIFRITAAEPNVVTILTEPENDGWFEDAEGNRIEPAPEALTAYVADPVDVAYQAQMDVKQAELSAAMRRPPRTPAAPQTPPPETPDISDSSGVDTTDPFGWNNHKEGSSNE